MITPARPALFRPTFGGTSMATRRILVVDGDYDSCDTLVETLRGHGYQVDFAYDAQSALELVRQRPYGLALLDHWPPYLDAFGLYRRLRLTAPGVKTVIFGDRTVEESADAIYNPDVTRVLPRTVGCDSIVSLVDDLLARPGEIVAA